MMILPTPLESLFLALKAVKREVEDGTAMNCGICTNVAVQVAASQHAFIKGYEHRHQLEQLQSDVQAHLYLMFESLGLSHYYPVPSPDPNFSAAKIFFRRDIPKWTGEYGAARRALLEQLIERCGKLLDVPVDEGNDER